VLGSPALLAALVIGDHRRHDCDDPRRYLDAKLAAGVSFLQGCEV
jgi:hypothetical protein